MEGLSVSVLEAVSVLTVLLVQALGVGIAYERLRGKQNAQERDIKRTQRLLLLGIRLMTRRQGFNTDDREWLEGQLAEITIGGGAD